MILIYGNVLIRGVLVSADGTAAIITAGLLERKLDYGVIFDQVRELVDKERDENTNIYLGGEPILYGWREGIKHQWCGDRNQGDVWHVEKPIASPLHPTMKPLALVERAIENSSKLGGKVLDLFLGSGSTLIACERTGRTCYGIELDPLYVDIAIARWEAFTGEKARLSEEEKS